MDNTNKNIPALTDDAIVRMMAEFIKHHRLEQNKTQTRLAADVGINRSTLIEFEKGKRVNLLTFIQLLRSLNLLYTLEQFQVQTQISPIQLTKLQQSKRKRASSTRSNHHRQKSDW